MEIVKGQPLKLPDGTIVLPAADKETGSTVLSKEQQEEQAALEETNRELEDLLTNPIDNAFTQTYKRTLADINVDYSRMNVVMLVLSYTLWGLDSYAISRVLNISIDQVEALQQSDTYVRCKQELVEAIRYAEAATVHGYLTEKAHAAARVVATSLKSGSSDVRLAAAKDILDRSGFRPVDRVEHSIKFEDELRIRYVSDEGNTPTIDLEVEK